MAERLRLMSVHAHPDDESSKGAATLARYVAEGAEVMVVTCTGGERGDVLNPALAGDAEVAADLGQVRRREMAAAVDALGVRHSWLGFVDSGLPEGDPLPPLPPGCFALEDLEVAAAALVGLVRAFRPHVMITYDENGGYPHPDHIMCHRVSVEAFEAAGDPDRYPADPAGAAEPAEPWQPLKLYYDRMFSPSKLRALHQGSLDAGMESPFAGFLERVEGDADAARRYEAGVTTRIVCADWFEQRERALRAHATQIDPNSLFFMLPLDIQRAAWPTEEFQLVRSLVDAPTPEDDLFAGVREHVRA